MRMRKMLELNILLKKILRKSKENLVTGILTKLRKLQYRLKKHYLEKSVYLHSTCLHEIMGVFTTTSATATVMRILKVDFVFCVLLLLCS